MNKVKFFQVIFKFWGADWTLTFQRIVYKSVRQTGKLGPLPAFVKRLRQSKTKFVCCFLTFASVSLSLTMSKRQRGKGIKKCAARQPAIGSHTKCYSVKSLLCEPPMNQALCCVVCKWWKTASSIHPPIKIYSVLTWSQSGPRVIAHRFTSVLGSTPMLPCQTKVSSMLDKSFIPLKSAIHLITAVPAYLLGLT